MVSLCVTQLGGGCRGGGGGREAGREGEELNMSLDTK